MEVWAALFLLPIARKHDVHRQLTFHCEDCLARVQEHPVWSFRINCTTCDNHLRERVHLHKVCSKRRRRPIFFVERLRVIHHVTRDGLLCSSIIVSPYARKAIGLYKLRLLAANVFERLLHQLCHLLNTHLPATNRRLPEVALNFGDMFCLMVFDILVNFLDARGFKNILSESPRLIKKVEKARGNGSPKCCLAR